MHRTPGHPVRKARNSNRGHPSEAASASHCHVCGNRSPKQPDTTGGALRIIEVQPREDQGLGLHCHVVALTDRLSPTTATVRSPSQLSTEWRTSCRLAYAPQVDAQVIDLRESRRLARLGYYLRKSWGDDLSCRRSRRMLIDPDHAAAVALVFKGCCRMSAAGLMKQALAAGIAEYRASRPQPSLPPRAESAPRTPAKVPRRGAPPARQRPSTPAPSQEASPRPQVCTRCACRFIVSRRTKYCGAACAAAVRRERQRASNKVYQATANGTRHHNERQRRYRARKGK